MKLLQTLVKPGKTVLRSVALMVLELLSSAGYENLLLLFAEASGKAELMALMAAMDTELSSDSESSNGSEDEAEEKTAVHVAATPSPEQKESAEEGWLAKE